MSISAFTTNTYQPLRLKVLYAICLWQCRILH